MSKSAVNGTSSSHFRAFFLLYAFAFSFFRVKECDISKQQRVPAVKPFSVGCSLGNGSEVYKVHHAACR